MQQESHRSGLLPLAIANRTILVIGKLSPVEPVVRLAIASGSNPDLWHIMGSAAITQDDVLKYYELTKV